MLRFPTLWKEEIDLDSYQAVFSGLWSGSFRTDIPTVPQWNKRGQYGKRVRRQSLKVQCCEFPLPHSVKVKWFCYLVS